MPVFSPPTHDVNPPVLPRPEPSRLAYRLFRHYKSRAVGRSVLKTAGVYHTVDTPTVDQMVAATEVYQGGHLYPIDEAKATELQAAGYTVAPVGTWASYAGRTWADTAVTWETA